MTKSESLTLESLTLDTVWLFSSEFSDLKRFFSGGDSASAKSLTGGVKSRFNEGDGSFSLTFEISFEGKDEAPDFEGEQDT